MASRSLGSLTLDLLVKIGAFTQGMDQASRITSKRMSEIEKRAYSFGQGIGKALKSAGAQFLAFAGVTVTVGAAFNALKGAIDNADALRDLSIRSGVGVESLSKLSYAAKQTGTDVDELGKGLFKLSKNLTAALDPKTKQANLFKTLGLNQDDLRDLNLALPKIAESFKNLADGPTKAALAIELFGKSGANLTEFLNSGAEGLKAFGDRAEELGIVIGTDTANAADAFNDKLSDLKAAGQGLATQIAADLLPQLTSLVDWAIEFVSKGTDVSSLTSDLKSGFNDLADALSTAGSVGGGFLDFMASVRTSLAGLQSDLGNAVLDLANFYSVTNQQRAFVEQQRQSYNKSGGRDFSNVKGGPTNLPTVTVTGSMKQFAAQQAAERKKQLDFQKELNKYLADPTPAGAKKSGGAKKAKAGKTQEQKDAEDLKAAYDKLIASQNEQIALFGKTGEAAQVRYDIEFGELKNLTPLQKESAIANAEKLDQLRVEADLQKELDEVNKRREDAAAGVLKDLQSEIDLLGATNEQRDLYNRLASAGVDANTALGESIANSVHQLHEQGDAMQTQIGLMDDFRSGAEDALTAFVTGTKSAGDALKDFFNDLAAQITKAIASQWIKKLFGETGSSSGGAAGDGWGALFGKLLGSFGGGRAGGGSVRPGRFYEVGEMDRSELFMAGGRQFLIPGNAGSVSPSQSGSGQVVQNLSFNFRERITRDTANQAAVKFGSMSQRQLNRNR